MSELFPTAAIADSDAQRRDAIQAVRAELTDALAVPGRMLRSRHMQRALNVAANVIQRVDLVHGDGTAAIRSAQTGNYASFHHGRHTREVATGAAAYLAQTGERKARTMARALLAGAYHDIIQGQTQPGLNEELSAQIAEQELRGFGYTAAAAASVGAAVRGTQLVGADGRIRQKAYDSSDPVVVATAVGDLGGLAQARGPAHSLTLFAEFNPDLFTAHDGPLTHTQMMAAIDAASDGTQRFGAYVTGQADFFERVEYPAATDGAVDQLYPLRRQNAAFLREMGGLMLEGALTASQAYASAGDLA